MAPHTTDELLPLLAWRPLCGCPGRHVLRDPITASTDPAALLVSLGVNPPPVVRAWRVAAAVDEVLVARLADGGGLISYRRADGTHCHTLNTPAGMARKLAQLGITDDDLT